MRIVNIFLPLKVQRLQLEYSKRFYKGTKCCLYKQLARFLRQWSYKWQRLLNTSHISKFSKMDKNINFSLIQNRPEQISHVLN